MAGSRGFLERFRAVGTPGAASAAGVPADRVAERDAELAALFEQLAPVQAAAESIRTEAVDRGKQRLEHAETHARAVVSQARRDAEAVRRDAAARVTAEADHEAAEVLERAEAEAAAIAAHASAVVGAMTERVLREVDARLGLPKEGTTRAASTGDSNGGQR